MLQSNQLLITKLKITENLPTPYKQKNMQANPNITVLAQVRQNTRTHRKLRINQ